MNLSEFDFLLPVSLVASIPVSPRDHSRLLVLDRKNGSARDMIFNQLTDLLIDGDVLVVNNTRVIPARLDGQKRETGAKIELLLLKPYHGNHLSSDGYSDTWEVLVRPYKRVKEGTEIIFGSGELTARICIKSNELVVADFEYKGNFKELLNKLGRIPLPPYIKRPLKEEDREWYQTVYAEKEGAVAAPTAGFHFTEELIERIRKKGVRFVPVTLHVGWGTFRPVRENDIIKHRMESEFYELSCESAEEINKAKKEHRRVIAVGTTTTRVLETAGSAKGMVKNGSGYTDIFIYPGYEFRVIDGLITNFHLPKSTLLMLVSAFAGRENIFRAYEYAVSNKYRFYSYGDAMFII